MIETLQQIDEQLLLAINGWHCPLADTFMWHVSKPYSWALILLASIIINARKGWKQCLIFILAVAISVAIADQISSTLIKNTVMRLRPTHAPALEGLIHLVRDYRGGMYGFVSSHAANSFAVAVLVGRMMPHRQALYALLAWACLQCYSRMYLGVHYPGDILGGMIVGVATACAVLPLWKRYCDNHTSIYTIKDSKLITISVPLTLLIITAISIIPN